MDALLPYLGIGLVIIVGTGSAILLSRYGLRLRRVKHDKTEVEFLTPESGADREAHNDQEDKPTIFRQMIELTEAAEKDCRASGIPLEEPVDFVLREATRHPILFSKQFSSLPLVFGQNVLLLSWDTASGRIERILNREEAYPLNDSWTSCLSIYRQATLLPYRTQGTDRLYTPTEAKRTLNFYKRLVKHANEFLSLLKKHVQCPAQRFQDIETLFEEAEFALANDDVGKMVSRLEAVLSTVHKLILQCAPRGGAIVSQDETGHVEEVVVPDEGKQSVLMVDDDPQTLKFISMALEDAGFVVTIADTIDKALKAMVEHEFDVVITDIVMFPFDGVAVDGREVALVAKRSSKKTKVVVCTSYMRMYMLSEAELAKEDVDILISKVDATPMKMVEQIRELLE